MYTHLDFDSESDTAEVWNEKEEHFPSDYQEPQDEPPVFPQPIMQVHFQSKALTVWLLHFCLFAQAAYHISDKALTFFL